MNQIQNSIGGKVIQEIVKVHKLLATQQQNILAIREVLIKALQDEKFKLKGKIGCVGAASKKCGGWHDCSDKKHLFK